jgi:outer membrane protein assembly factor BamA
VSNKVIIPFLFVVLMSSCTANKFLPTGEKYYEGSSIEITSDKKLNSYDKHEPEEDIEEVFNIDPNLKILGARPRVWFYHLAGDLKKEKGFRYWLKYKLGEEPVYLSKVNIGKTRQLIRNRLTLNGYFDHNVSHKVDSGKNKASINYFAKVDEPFTYDSIGQFVPDSVQILRTLNGFQEGSQSLLKNGARYDFEDLQNERQQLELYLRNNGYYFFDGRFILYEADSTIGNNKINLYPKIKDKIEESALDLYKIAEVIIYTDYKWAMDDSTSQTNLDSLEFDNLIFIGSMKDLRADVIASHIGFRPGDIYNREIELNTLNRLIQLDIFQYVNVAFEQKGNGELKVNIYLSPAKKKSLRSTIEGVSTSNNFVGPHLTGTFLNRNFLDGER